MGRKNIRKNLVDKTINDKVETGASSDNVMNVFIKTLVGVLAVIGVVYFVLNTFMEKEEDVNVDPVDYTEELGYSKILAQDTFNKPEDDYVVFFMNGEEGKDEVNNYFASLAQGTLAPKIYVVDMAEQVNSHYLFDNSEAEEKYGRYATADYNKTPSNIDELEVYNFPTVIRVTGGQFVAYYEGDEFYDALGIANPSSSTSLPGQ